MPLATTLVQYTLKESWAHGLSATTIVGWWWHLKRVGGMPLAQWIWKKRICCADAGTYLLESIHVVVHHSEITLVDHCHYGPRRRLLRNDIIMFVDQKHNHKKLLRVEPFFMLCICTIYFLIINLLIQPSMCTWADATTFSTLNFRGGIAITSGEISWKNDVNICILSLGGLKTSRLGWRNLPTTWRSPRAWSWLHVTDFEAAFFLSVKCSCSAFTWTMSINYNSRNDAECAPQLASRQTMILQELQYLKGECSLFYVLDRQHVWVLSARKFSPPDSS